VGGQTSDWGRPLRTAAVSDRAQSVVERLCVLTADRWSVVDEGTSNDVNIRRRLPTLSNSAKIDQNRTEGRNRSRVLQCSNVARSRSAPGWNGKGASLREERLGK